MRFCHGLGVFPKCGLLLFCFKTFMILLFRFIVFIVEPKFEVVGEVVTRKILGLLYNPSFVTI